MDVIKFVIVAVVVCLRQLQGEEQIQQNNELRFFNQPIRPTAAVTHHEPGLPPRWTRPPTRPTNRPNGLDSWFGFNIFSTNVTRPQEIIKPTYEEIVESPELTVSSTPNTVVAPSRNNSLPPGVFPPEAIIVDQGDPNRNAFFDWLSGLFGNRPTNKPTQRPPSTNCQKCSCGLSYKHKRIVGGIETMVNAYPWMTFLTYNGRFYCGASVINDRYILTAAHCVSGFQKDRLSATFLDHDRSSTYETKTFTRQVSNILKHTSYNTGGAYNNDIALLRLDQELPFDGLLKPVCLPPTGRSFSGYTGIATGWGATETAGQVSNTLREVEVPILSNVDCRKTGYGTRITENMLCAGYPEGAKDSCQGDSGGPLHILNETLHTIVGIVSWGEGCAEPNFPGVYTRVNRYVSWIKSNTRDACYCEN